MLQITVPAREYFDDNKQEFITQKEQTLSLEHSLISISKWESKWQKPFLDDKGRTYEEFIDYVRCMTLNTGVDQNVYNGITQDQITEITNYIDNKMTATWFNDKENKQNGRGGGNKGQTATSELIYYWMIAYEIPFECQKWHLNRLLTLIRICEVKNAPAKKMKKKDIYARNRALNESRRKALGSKG